jgi:hypothetical protein
MTTYEAEVERARGVLHGLGTSTPSTRSSSPPHGGLDEHPGMPVGIALVPGMGDPVAFGFGTVHAGADHDDTSTGSDDQTRIDHHSEEASIARKVNSKIHDNKRYFGRRDNDKRGIIDALKKEFRFIENGDDNFVFLRSAFDLLECSNVETLIKELSIDVNRRNNIGETILFRLGDVDDVIMLLNVGCDPNIQNNNGDTVLHTSECDDISYILYKVTDLTLKNKYGMTPVDINFHVRKLKHMDDMEKYLGAIAYAPGGPVFVSAKESFDTTAAIVRTLRAASDGEDRDASGISADPLGGDE